jgi:hypothetical protein
MKLNDSTRFPHPVLDEENGDYRSGEFGIRLTEVTENHARSEVTLDYQITLTEQHLVDAVTSDVAGVGIFVSCRDTYYSRLVSLSLQGARFSFEPGVLAGRVVLRPLVWARKPINGYPLENCHVEFGGQTADFGAATVLALADEIVINVGREKLAQIETIFSLARSDDLAANTLTVDLDDEKIRILAAGNIYDTVNTLRKLVPSRPIILNSVYLPAVMQVLDSLKEGSASYEGRRWYRVFSAKCDHLQIDVDNPDLWQDAQRLLHAPFAEIETNKETLGA